MIYNGIYEGFEKLKNDGSRTLILFKKTVRNTSIDDKKKFKFETSIDDTEDLGY